MDPRDHKYFSISLFSLRPEVAFMFKTSAEGEKELVESEPKINGIETNALATIFKIAKIQYSLELPSKNNIIFSGKIDVDFDEIEADLILHRDNYKKGLREMPEKFWIIFDGFTNFVLLIRKCIAGKIAPAEIFNEQLIDFLEER